MHAPSTIDRWTLLAIVEALGLAVYGEHCTDQELQSKAIGGADGNASGVVIDTRQVKAGNLFVALQGSKTHGLEHAKDAFDRGAAAVLVGMDLELDDSRWNQMLESASSLGPVLVATDCDGVTALGRLARAWRRRSSWQVVGITGSSGKTSTKEILAALLRRAQINVVASRENWNNEIGVPLTLLSAGASTAVVICEMGMRGLKQIEWLCDIADPDIGIITTAGTAHLELLGTLEAIKSAKSEMLSGTWSGGVGIFPAVESELVEFADRTPDRLLPFGVSTKEHEDSAVCVTSLMRNEQGLEGVIDLMGCELRFTLPMRGLHQARNLAAAAAALVTITGSTQLLRDDALMLEGGELSLMQGRGDHHNLLDGGMVIDDSYNANPESMAAAIGELSEESGLRRVAVLGFMAELGEQSEYLHAELGKLVAESSAIDQLVLVGQEAELDALASSWKASRGFDPTRFQNQQAALSALEVWHHVGDVVLVKASNSVGLSRLTAALVERFGVAISKGDDKT